ncbi:MAG TPA: signal peptidase II [Chitinophagaceae bacterium]|nr:signal peptidase II [Chitinophagaceae bacterium]
MKKIVSKSRLKILLFCLSSLTLISWDRVTKDIAKDQLKDKAVHSYFHDSFRLEYVENTGAAMSFADNLPRIASYWILGIVPLVFLLGFFVYTILKSRVMPNGKIIAFALIFAGGIGNILDRLLFDRHVSDFMNLGILNLRTGIFNFADVWITAGVCYLVVWGRWGKKSKKQGLSDLNA